MLFLLACVLVFPCSLVFVYSTFFFNDGMVADQELLALRKHIRRLQQKKRRRDAAAVVAQTAVAPRRDMALAQLVYTLGQNSPAVLAHFLKRWGRCAKANSSESAVVEQMAQDVIWACRSERVVAAEAPVADQVAAARYVVEYNLFHWVFKQNTLHGVAPARAQLVDKAVALIPDGLSADSHRKLRVLLNGKPRSQRKWLAKFRKHWGARLGILKVAEILPLEQLQVKAGARQRIVQFFKPGEKTC